MARSSDSKFMQLALRKAAEGVKRGQSPFAACIVKDGRVVCCVHNSVRKDFNPTAHAEVNALREAGKRMGTYDLNGCTIYSTCEPCPMCYSACHWARISRIVYGARYTDARRFGFSEMGISVAQLRRFDPHPPAVTPNFMRAENLKVFKYWSQRKGHWSY